MEMVSRIKGYISKIKYAFRSIGEINVKMTEVSNMLIKNQNAVAAINSDIIEQRKFFDQKIKEIVSEKEQAEKRLCEIERFLTALSEKNAYVNFEYLYLLNNTKTKVLLAGFYGARNLGDELMMQKVYQDLDVDKSSVYVLMCDNPELNVFQYPGMNMIHYPKTKFDYSFLADQFDCVIFGGGAVIDDVMYRKKDSFTFDMGKIFAELGTAFIQRKKAVYSLGLSTSKELNDPEYIEKMKNIISRSRFFSVRDKYSAELLREITGQEINRINDIVLTYERPRCVEMRKTKFTIGIIWICYDDLKDQLYYLLEELLGFYRNIDLELRLIPFYDYCNCDYNFYLKTKEHFGNDERIVLAKMPGTFEDIYCELINCDLILSMRYHGALIGMMTGRETCSLLYGEHRHYYNKMLDIYEKFDHKKSLFSSVEELCRHVKRDDISDSQAEAQNFPKFDNSGNEKVIKEICADMKN